jgi:N-acetylglucosaminyldiphosphoundecaprenol N-acetyl-beta-D-mannosaminyltransferase
VVQRLVSELKRQIPSLVICGWYSLPFRSIKGLPWADDVARISAARPDMIWVGLGTPKHEFWMHVHTMELPESVLLGVGAAFDFHSKTKPEAPCWLC